jgi:hypothetical protein
VSAASLRNAIIAQYGHVHDNAGRTYKTTYVWGDNADPLQWSASYNDQRALAECIANAVEPEIRNTQLLNVKQRFDPTPNLPVGPTIGDIYLATATARGWTLGRLYTWNGATYDETVPDRGLEVWIVATNTASIWTSAEWLDLAESSYVGNTANVLAMGGGGGAISDAAINQVTAGQLRFGWNTVAGTTWCAGNLTLQFEPAAGYDVIFKTVGAAESYRVHSDGSLLMAGGNWLEFGEVNHYIRNKNNDGSGLQWCDLEIGSSYGNTVFLAGGGCAVAAESLRVGKIGAVVGEYGIQVPNIWHTGITSHVVKTDSAGKFVACSNLSDAAYQPAHAILTALAGLSYSSGTPFVKMTGASAFGLDTNTYLTASSTLDASKLSGTIPSGVLGNSSFYLGTTSIALNRGSAAMTLAGVTGFTPSANFVLTQNTHAAFTSEESGAVANTLYLKTGLVGVGASPSYLFDVYMNSASEIMANFTNANSSYASLVAFGGNSEDSVGYYNSSYPAYTSNLHGNLSPAYKLGIFGGSGVFVTTGGSYPIYLTVGYSSSVNFEINMTDIYARLPVTMTGALTLQSSLCGLTAGGIPMASDSTGLTASYLAQSGTTITQSVTSNNANFVIKSSGGDPWYGASLTLDRVSSSFYCYLIYSTNASPVWYAGTGLYNGGSASTGYAISQDNTLAHANFFISTGGLTGIGTKDPYHTLQTYGTLKVGGNANQQTGTVVLGDDQSANAYVGMYRGGATGTVGGASYLNLAGVTGINFIVGSNPFGSQTVMGRFTASGLYIPAFTSAGIVHNAASTGLLSSSLVVAADLGAIGTQYYIPVMGSTSVIASPMRTDASGSPTKVGIGCTPSYPFQIASSAASDNIIHVEGTGINTTGVVAKVNTAAASVNTGFYADVSGGTTNWGVYVNAGQSYFAGAVTMGSSLCGITAGTIPKGSASTGMTNSLMSDNGSTVSCAGNLGISGYVSLSGYLSPSLTEGTSSNHYNYYYPVLTISIPGQYQYGTAKILFSHLGAGSGAEYSTAMIHIHAKQQSAMSSPLDVMEIFAEHTGGNLLASDFIFVLTTDNGTKKEGTLYVRNRVSYTNIYYLVLNAGGYVSVAAAGTAGVSSLPSGTQYTPATGLNLNGALIGIGCAAAAGKTLDIQGAASSWACVRLTSPTSTYGGYFSVVNNSGNVSFGVETSAGGGLFTGSSAYAAVIGHSGNYPLQFATNNTVGMTLNTTGLGVAVVPSYKFDVYMNAASDIMANLANANTSHAQLLSFSAGNGTIGYYNGSYAAYVGNLSGNLAPANRLGIYGGSGVFITTGGSYTILITPGYSSTVAFEIGYQYITMRPAGTLTLGGLQSDRVNFVAGYGAAAPTANAGTTFTHYYGANTTTGILGTPAGWIDVQVNGAAQKVPYY